MARMMHRIIGRDSGISNAFSSPPLGLGIFTNLRRKSTCSIRTFFSAVGRDPLSSVRR
jgi:hypothetical protein